MTSNVFESIMQGLTEAAEYQQGKVNARKNKMSAERRMETKKQTVVSAPRRHVAAAAVL